MSESGEIQYYVQMLFLRFYVYIIVDLLVRYRPTEMSAISVIVTSIVRQEIKCRRAILWPHN